MKPGIKVFAPGSISNVCVGFDILGFAIHGPGDEIIISEGKESGLKITEIRGAKGKLPLDTSQNTAGVSALALLQHLGESGRPLEMIIHKKMPFGSGLGSSAASAVGGVFAVSEFLKTGLSKLDLLPFAIEGEKAADGAVHADNVAPSLLGGMIIIRDNVKFDVKKLPIPAGLFISVIYPHVMILTKESRAILKKEVPMDLFIKQQGNLAAFVSAMYTSDFGLLKKSLDDLVIEPQRAHLIPHFYELKEMALREGALGFSISGAGPSMFAICDNSFIAEEIAKQAQSLYSKQKLICDTYVSKINHDGAIVL
ncbi:MAG: homoserine kinase [Saprospiraceae bacterium]|nr:homoserine kinase [Saprospiraceae bacterium]